MSALRGYQYVETYKSTEAVTHINCNEAILIKCYKNNDSDHRNIRFRINKNLVPAHVLGRWKVSTCDYTGVSYYVIIIKPDLLPEVTWYYEDNLIELLSETENYPDNDNFFDHFVFANMKECVMMKYWNGVRLLSERDRNNDQTS